MKSFGAVVYNEFDNPSELPILPPPLGIPGAIARWSADFLPGAIGSTVAAWESIHSSHVLTGSATVAEDVDGKFLRFNGTTQQLGMSGIAGARTVGVLYRKPEGSSGGAVTAGASYFAGNPGGGFNVIGGTAQYPTPARRSHVWAWRYLSFDGTTRRFSTAAENDTTTAHTSTGITTIDLARYAGATYGACDIAGVVLWPFVVTQEQRQTATATWAAQQPNRAS